MLRLSNSPTAQFQLPSPSEAITPDSTGDRGYAFSDFGIHNSNGIAYLPGAYWQTYRYLHRKWRHWLPVLTSCMPITRRHGPAWRYLIRNLPSAFRAGRKPGKRVADPAGLLATLTITRPV